MRKNFDQNSDFNELGFYDDFEDRMFFEKERDHSTLILTCGFAAAVICFALAFTSWIEPHSYMKANLEPAVKTTSAYQFD